MSVEDSNSGSKVLDVNPGKRVMLSSLLQSGRIVLGDAVAHRLVEISGPATSGDQRDSYTALAGDVVVFLTASAQNLLIKLSAKWEEDVSHRYRGPLFWLDTKIRMIQIDEGGNILHLKSISRMDEKLLRLPYSEDELGTMGVNELYPYMLMNSMRLVRRS